MSTPAWTPSAVAQERAAYLRSRTRRSVGIGALSTVVLLGVAGYLLVASPGWPRVQQSFLDLRVARESFPAILKGLWLNVRILVVAEVAVLVVGLTIAALRTLRGPVFFPLRAFAAGYTDVFRGLPLIVLLYLVGFGIPGLRLQGVTTNAVVLGGLALVLTYSAYVAEVFRAGIESVHPSQRAAARSLGLTHAQTLRLVVLPQAVRRVAPPLLNDFVALQKDVGLISVLGAAVDAVRAAQIANAKYADFTPYVVAGLLFIALAIPSIRIADRVTLRAQRRQQAGSLL